jgi:ATP-dependent Clp protease protease subunit
MSSALFAEDGNEEITIASSTSSSGVIDVTQAAQIPPPQRRSSTVSDPATLKLKSKQQLLFIENNLEDEKLRKQFTKLRSRLQKLDWEKQELEQKLAIEQLKEDIANRETNRQQEEELKKLQQENDILTQKLSIANTKYELEQHELTTKNETELAKLTNEKNLLKEELEIETLKRENAQRELKLAHEEKLETLKRQKDLIKEELAVKTLERTKELQAAKDEFDDKITIVSREAMLASQNAEKLENELDAKRSEWQLKTVQLESEIEKLEIEKKRKAYIDATPVYLKNPLKDNNTLVISDRRIPLNGVIRRGTADYITSRINYYNNMDTELPIFIVIDSSPGGSVMEGYRIVKAMEGSDAPVYVVVKSYAASMAAAITAVAEKSFAYPNAIFLHHQLSTSFFFATLNLTQQKELHEDSQRWWKRLAEPIAKKMGISTNEFIKKMYEKSSDGDWSEFGTEAKKLKWVDTIVTQIRETSLLKDPNIEEKKFTISLEKGTDDNGAPIMYLPRLTPRDHYYLYNPDNYYRMR